MPERRMFAKTIIDSDAFLDMPLSAQALYFHLSMRADDEGFVNNPKKITRMIGSDESNLKELIEKRFLLPFESGVVVIKHWKIHNNIRADRLVETVYKEERDKITVKINGAYTFKPNVRQMSDMCQTNDGQVTDKCQSNDGKMSAQVRLGKDSIDKDNIYCPVSKENISEIVSYLNEKAHTKYRLTTKKTISLINSRLREHYTVEDFKAVIDYKCKEWLGTKMAQYLSPDTLFGNHFEKYINQAKTCSETKYETIMDISVRPGDEIYMN